VHERYAKVALCLTRHDLIFGEPRRTLVTQLGLPNIISTDAWIFREPIDLRFSAYYSQGQIFCDQFFNHDLIESGYRLFNPCLDCVIMHQEEDVKDLQYYSNAAKGSQAQQSVVEHWRRSARYTTGCYYGIAHTSSKALADGYDPAPLLVSKTGRRLMVTFPPNVFAGGAASAAPRYIELASSWDFDLYLLTHTTTEHSELEGLLSRCGGSRAYVFQAENPESVACALMRGLDSHFPNAWLVGHQTHVSADELPTFDTVFVFHDSSPNQGAGLEEAARRLIWTSRLGERTASFLAKCLMHHQPLAVGWASTPEESIRRRAEYNGTFHGKDDT
jgi:hypothetical protein